MHFAAARLGFACITGPAVVYDPQPFAVPKEIRELAEKNIDKPKAAFGQCSNAMASAMSMWTKAVPENNLTSGFAMV